MSKLRIPVNEKDHQTGNSKAKVTLVEFGDYQCPHCGIEHPLIKRLLKRFGNKMHFVFRNFPLQKAHPAAMIDALSAEAADLQERFWRCMILFMNIRMNWMKTVWQLLQKH